MEYGNSEGQSCIYIFQDSVVLHVEMPQGHITCHKLMHINVIVLMLIYLAAEKVRFR